MGFGLREMWRVKSCFPWCPPAFMTHLVLGQHDCTVIERAAHRRSRGEQVIAIKPLNELGLFLLHKLCRLIFIFCYSVSACDNIFHPQGSLENWLMQLLFQTFTLNNMLLVPQPSTEQLCCPVGEFKILTGIFQVAAQRFLIMVLMKEQFFEVYAAFPFTKVLDWKQPYKKSLPNYDMVCVFLAVSSPSLQYLESFTFCTKGAGRCLGCQENPAEFCTYPCIIQFFWKTA